jgi:hypothetical protein
MTGDVAQCLPPVLYVPVRSVPAGEQDLELELSRLTDGRVAALAYTSLDRLVAACGATRPWALLPTAQLGRLHDEGTVDVIALDPELPAQHRPGAGAHDG